MIHARQIHYFYSIIKSKVIQTGNGLNRIDLAAFETSHASIDSAVILNNNLNEIWLKKGLNACKQVIAADGGANQLYNTPYRNNQKFSAIVGDFDSIKDEVKQFYQQRGVEIEKIDDYNKNDFEKAFDKAIRKNLKTVLCLGAFGDRMDHTLATMSSTAKLCNQYKQLEIILAGLTNIMYFMRGGIRHRVKVSEDINTKGCGIIRFGSKVKVTTKGFRWNMGPSYDFDQLEWGNFLSTSNQIVDDTVEIECEGDLFLSLHLKKQ